MYLSNLRKKSCEREKILFQLKSPRNMGHVVRVMHKNEFIANGLTIASSSFHLSYLPFLGGDFLQEGKDCDSIKLTG